MRYFVNRAPGCQPHGRPHYFFIQDEPKEDAQAQIHHICGMVHDKMKQIFTAFCETRLILC